MKKLIFKISLLILMVFAPASVMAGVTVHVDIPLPPPIIFPVSPVPIVIPETNIYVVPDIQDDIFFYGGWWWRPWEGRWYRSHHYDRGWVYYRGMPSFHRHVPPGWRDNYRDRQWKGHPWQHQRIPPQELQRNWRGWERNKYWERHNTWGVQGLPPKHKKYPRDERERGDMQPPPGPPPGHGHGPR